jgi:hypothetical protein
MLGSRLIPVIFVVLALSLVAQIRSETPEEDEWLIEDDSKSRTDAVNTGGLVFLSGPPERPVHHHHNTLTLLPRTLEDGWAQLHQCHEHIDPVPRLEVVYHPERVRKLTIESFEGIGSAGVQGASVQLQDVRPGARLCISAESLALEPRGGGVYVVRNGPFMRKFLDGYYPMHVSMDVHLPKGLLFSDISPREQEGFKVWHSPGAVHFETWFEGRLNTEMLFRADPRLR